MSVMTDEEYEVYRKTELSAFAFSSQAKGIFSMLENSGEGALTGVARKLYLNDITLKRYDRALSLSKKYGVPISSVIMVIVSRNSAIQHYFDTKSMIWKQIFYENLTIPISMNIVHS